MRVVFVLVLCIRGKDQDCKKDDNGSYIRAEEGCSGVATALPKS